MRHSKGKQGVKEAVVKRGVGRGYVAKGKKKIKPKLMSRIFLLLMESVMPRGPSSCCSKIV